MASWIWLRKKDFVRDAYCVFRRVVCVSAKAPVLRVSASSLFEVRLNGVVIPGTQYSDLPGAPTYTELPLKGAWKAGENELVIRVYALGRESLTTAVQPPALWAEIRDGRKLLDATDETWQGAVDPNYASGKEVFLSNQLGNAFEFDCRAKAPKWVKAVAQKEQFPQPVARPEAVPYLREQPAPAARVVQAGQLFRSPEATGTAAELMNTDFLQSRIVDHEFVNPGTEDLQSWRYSEPIPFLLSVENAEKMPFRWRELSGGANGWYLIVDLEDEYTGWLTVTMEVAKNAVVEIGHGEHLVDGKIRMEVGKRNYADRIISAGGVLRFTHRLRRLGCRYLEIHVTGTQTPPKMGYLGIIPLLRELPEPTPFVCGDRLLETMDAVAIRTLLCCQHEHFEDCPMREQGLYPYDSRNQALFGYPIWGNYEFVSACYRLLGGNWCEGAGTLQMTSPGCIHLSIPIFGLVWMPACWELYLHSGDASLVTPMLPVMARILQEVFAKTVVSKAGILYHPGTAPEIWNFCEWQPGLDRMKSKFQLPYNLYLVEALRAAAKLASLADCPDMPSPKTLEDTADRLAKTCHKFFWDEKEGLYRTDESSKTPFHEHMQVMAICTGLAKGADLKKLCKSMKEKELYPSTFSTLPYWIRAMRMLGGETAQEILPRLRNLYEPSLLAGTKTLWETEVGSEDFSFAGSLCHGWSSIPAWYFRTGILGIEPTAPGYATFRFQPDFVPELNYASGAVATPHGLITAEWRRNADGTCIAKILSCPKACVLEK